jgi:hypothetical protein
VGNGWVRSDLGEILTDIRVPIAGINGRGAGVNAGELPVVPCEDRADDGVPNDESKPMAKFGMPERATSRPIARRSGACGRGDLADDEQFVLAHKIAWDRVNEIRANDGVRGGSRITGTQRSCRW